MNSCGLSHYDKEVEGLTTVFSGLNHIPFIDQTSVNDRAHCQDRTAFVKTYVFIFGG